MSSQFPHLLQLIGIGSKQARNRSMRLATYTNIGEEASATDLTVAVYRRLRRVDP